MRVAATLDRTSGLLVWRFTSLDPVTGEPTEDPLAGFLPPNVNPPAGEGHVLFTVQPKPGLLTGTTICNQASIVFDTNAPIVTPQRCNTLDRTAPASQVQPLTSPQFSTTFDVSWSGTDEGAGIGGYTVFVSENNGPFTVFASDTASTSAPFIGEIGKIYAFYSIATDSARQPGGCAEPTRYTHDARRVRRGQRWGPGWRR